VCCRENVKASVRVLAVIKFLASKQISMLEHPPHSPNLVPSNFFLFPKIKEILKGRHFDDIDDIRSNTRATLMAIPKNEFQNCFEGWTRPRHRRIASQGESTLKVTTATVIFSNEVCTTFTVMSSRTLLSDNVGKDVPAVYIVRVHYCHIH
jgi:hypothetical protein